MDKAFFHSGVAAIDATFAGGSTMKSGGGVEPGTGIEELGDEVVEGE